MCSNLRLKSRIIPVGTHLITYSKKGSDYKRWGNSYYHNARIEKLNGFFKNFDRCFIECTEFFEGLALFQAKSTEIMKLASVEDESGVFIITKSSVGTVVQPYHNRMPVVLADSRMFTSYGQIVEMPTSLLKLVI